MLSVVKFEDNTPNVLHTSVEEFFYPIMEDTRGIMKKIIGRICHRINDKPYILTKERIDSSHIDSFIVLNTIMQDASDQQIDIAKSFCSYKRHIDRMLYKGSSRIFSCLSGMCMKGKITGLFDKRKIFMKTWIFQ